jgi:hypothetical protein
MLLRENQILPVDEEVIPDRMATHHLGLVAGYFDPEIKKRKGIVCAHKGTLLDIPTRAKKAQRGWSKLKDIQRI